MVWVRNNGKSLRRLHYSFLLLVGFSSRRLSFTLAHQCLSFVFVLQRGCIFPPFFSVLFLFSFPFPFSLLSQGVERVDKTPIPTVPTRP